MGNDFFNFTLDADGNKVQKKSQWSKGKGERSNQKNPYNGRNGQTDQNNHNRDLENRGEGYVGAPYNFVPFSAQIQSVKPNRYNDTASDSLSGEIVYRMEAKTPVIVDDGNGNFHRDANGQCSIPGSTVRGMIRSNVQILGLSQIGEDIDDYALIYRTVAGGDKKQRDRYNAILGVPQEKQEGNMGVLKEVKAGYIAREGGKYVIYQTQVDEIDPVNLGKMNYYVLSERHIIDACNVDGSDETYSFFYENNDKMMNKIYDLVPGEDGKEHKQKVRFERKETTTYRRGNAQTRVSYIRLDPQQQKYKAEHYKPYFRKVKYLLNDQKKVSDVIPFDESEREGYLTGYVQSSGYMNQKKVVYIIPEIDQDKEKLVLTDEDVKVFQRDFEKKKNGLKRTKNVKFFALPSDDPSDDTSDDPFDTPSGEPFRPVFYLEMGGRICFGYTPRLRLPYDHTIKEGIPEKHLGGVKDDEIDYAKAMFGFVDRDSARARKGRLSFSDAVLEGEEVENPSQNYVLEVPKPTSYMDYLKQVPGTSMTYNDSGFELRGVKQYWLHDEVVDAVQPSGDSQSEGEAPKGFAPLDQKSVFRGRIRFQNLKPVELGLLLWSVRLEEDSQMNVGKAKAYGYGNVKVSITDLRLLDWKKAYGLEQLDFEPYQEGDFEQKVDGYISLYKEQVKQYLSGKVELEPDLPIEESYSVFRDFFLMKNAKKMPDPKSIEYMKLEQYRNRTELKTPKHYAKE